MPLLGLWGGWQLRDSKMESLSQMGFRLGRAVCLACKSKKLE